MGAWGDHDFYGWGVAKAVEDADCVWDGVGFWVALEAADVHTGSVVEKSSDGDGFVKGVLDLPGCEVLVDVGVKIEVVGLCEF